MTNLAGLWQTSKYLKSSHHMYLQRVQYVLKITFNLISRRRLSCVPPTNVKACVVREAFNCIQGPLKD